MLSLHISASFPTVRRIAVGFGLCGLGDLEFSIACRLLLTQRADSAPTAPTPIAITMITTYIEMSTNQIMDKTPRMAK